MKLLSLPSLLLTLAPLAANNPLAAALADPNALVSFNALANTDINPNLHPRAQLGAIFERQTIPCRPVPPPYTCERSCGAGYAQCVFPRVCYNAAAGQKCCSNGHACPPTSYCTNTGCCPLGLSLAECGAVRTVDIVLPGPVRTQTEEGSTSTSTSTSATTRTLEFTSVSTSEFTSEFTSTHTTELTFAHTSTSTSAATYTVATTVSQEQPQEPSQPPVVLPSPSSSLSVLPPVPSASGTPIGGTNASATGPPIATGGGAVVGMSVFGGLIGVVGAVLLL